MPDADPPKPKRKRRWLRRLGWLALLLLVAAVAVRLALPRALTWYVNRVLAQDPLYAGRIDEIDVSLHRGAYTIRGVTINKTVGQIPVPLFAADAVDLSVEWRPLLSGKVVGRVTLERPQLNFVDGGSGSKDSSGDADGQTGAGGPWLQILDDLFPFDLNSCEIESGSVHLQAFNVDPPVDVYLDHIDGVVENVTNVQDTLVPLNGTIQFTAMAMGSGDVTLAVKFDPTSYRPTFSLTLQLLNLDVTKTNALTRAYGDFDFEGGFFDLVVELESSEGSLEGTVKPLFRNLKVFSLRKDLPEDDLFQVFWEALVGTTTGVLTNQPRQQFGTLINVGGEIDQTEFNVFRVVFNVLRNAFVRAYLPRLEGEAPDTGGLMFQTKADGPG